MNKPARRRSYIYGRFHMAGAFLLGCCFATAMMTFFHITTLSAFHDSSAPSSVVASVHQQLHSTGKARRSGSATTKKQEHLPATSKSTVKKLAINHDNNIHSVAGLDCSQHDGPERMEDAQEMAYWRDIQADNAWISPFRKEGTRQYLTFEPDAGGWNNIRMSMGKYCTSLKMFTGYIFP